MSFITICLFSKQQILKILKEKNIQNPIYIKHVSTKYMKICFQLSGYMHFLRMKVIYVDLKKVSGLLKTVLCRKRVLKQTEVAS